MEERNKKINQYSNAALFAAILLFIFGFGTGLVNVLLLGFAVILAFLALTRNKEKIKNVRIKSILSLIIVLISIILYFVGFSGVIGFIFPELLNF